MTLLPMHACKKYGRATNCKTVQLYNCTTVYTEFKPIRKICCLNLAKIVFQKLIREGDTNFMSHMNMTKSN